ncbi:MAG TPA: TlpA disulfide reductase family protein [Desulfovibrio sp.]|jgi:thiol-disulfide isomerase/thioredoxin|uniref:TlpA family protein disulfide reductase n=1 Tax=Desulfovibrio TaxID=872 RepID=UPI0003FCABB9|nr:MULTISPECIES: TlpA disulfide reductase family protein [Desulfovibrio]MDY0305706.1 TlpA disulfide reductase family protein [Desulfovibrionaceae bacterium]HMM40158.1 TlpA disulfide reductase family protein [Desulfovibrio sp.]
MNSRLFLARLLAAALLAVALFSTTACGGSEPPRKTSGGDWPAVDAAGVKALVAESKGAPLLLCFWTTWCPSCRQEMGELAKIRSAYKPEQLRVVAVSLDESVDALKEFFKDKPPVEVLHAGPAVGQAYGIESIPHLMIYDRDGKQVFNRPGAYPFAMLDGLIKGHVKE